MSERERVEKAKQAAASGQEQKENVVGALVSEGEPVLNDEAAQVQAEEEDAEADATAADPGKKQAGEKKKEKMTSQRPDRAALRTFNEEQRLDQETRPKGPEHMLGHIPGIDIAHR